MEKYLVIQIFQKQDCSGEFREIFRDMPRLFSYTMPIDDGAAPNPFHGMCSLAICKPAIRRVARQGDWIAGLGSQKAPSGDLSGHLVYAMHVEQVLTLEEYDRQAPTSWPHRIPNIHSINLWDRLGDCIYDYSKKGDVRQRPSVHGEKNMSIDIKGGNVLISRDFYYWGSHAILLPDYLRPIMHQRQGHRSTSNNPYFEAFVSWVRGLSLKSGHIYGWPDFIINWNTLSSCGGCIIRKIDDEEDGEVGEE